MYIYITTAEGTHRGETRGDVGRPDREGPTHTWSTRVAGVGLRPGDADDRVVESVGAQGEGGEGSDALDDGAGRERSPAAHRDQRERRIGPLQLVERGGDQARARR